MRFEDAVEHVLAVEKGYVNHPRDPGGETNFGISKRSYPNVDIKNLTREGAIAIYRRDFWDQPNIGALPPCLRLLVFDAAVNQGVAPAIGMLQAAVGTKVDGDLGDKTLAKVHALPLDKVIGKYAYNRWRRYAQSSRFPDFGEGWGARLLAVSLECARQLPAQVENQQA